MTWDWEWWLRWAVILAAFAMSTWSIVLARRARRERIELVKTMTHQKHIGGGDLLLSASDPGLRGCGTLELFEGYTVRITHEHGHLDASFDCNPDELRYFFRDALAKLGGV